MIEYSLDCCPVRNIRLEINLNTARISVRTGDYYRFDYSNLSNEVHQHDCHELVYVLSGRGRFVYGEEEVLLHAGGLFLSDPYMPHEIHINPKETLSLLYIMLKIEYRKKAPPESGREDAVLRRFADSHRNALDKQIVLQSYISFFEEYGRLGDVRKDYWFARALENFIFHALELLSPGAATSAAVKIAGGSLLESALDYIDKHLTEKISAEDIARAVHTSRRNLYRIFRQHLNCSVHDYVKEKKVSLAQNYLHMNLSVSKTAELIGMDSLSSFSRLFKHYTGVPPREYRKRFCRNPEGYGRRLRGRDE